MFETSVFHNWHSEYRTCKFAYKNFYFITTLYIGKCKIQLLQYIKLSQENLSSIAWKDWQSFLGFVGLRHIQQNDRVIQGLDGNLYFSHVTVADNREDYTCNTQFPSARIIMLKDPIKLTVVPCKTAGWLYFTHLFKSNKDVQYSTEIHTAGIKAWLANARCFSTSARYYFSSNIKNALH